MNKKIVRADIAAYLFDTFSERIGKEDSLRIVDCVINKMKNELMAGNTIELRGFGSFLTKKRAGRHNARNPKTGELLEVQPHYAVTFKPGSELKKAIREIKIDV